MNALRMIRPNLQDIPAVNIPDGFELRAIKADERQQWEELCAGIFNQECSFAINIEGRVGYIEDGVFVIVDKLDGDKVVATGTTFCPQQDTDEFCHLEYIAACPECSGKGLGREITAATLRRLRDGGVSVARLSTWDFCLPAIKIYLDLGFAPDLTVDETMPSRWESIYAALGKKIIYKEGMQGLIDRAQQGDADAQFRLGEAYKDKDPEQALAWILKAAEQGHRSAQYDLYFYYCEITGNLEQANIWLKKAAEQGHCYAQIQLAWNYYHGDGVERSPQLSAMWLEKAAEQGLIDAQRFLGDAYRNGDGVQQDYTIAIKWYTKAAEQVNVLESQVDDAKHAKYTLGFMYYSGYGVERDFKQAEKWFRTAAEMGDENAWKMLRMVRMCAES